MSVFELIWPHPLQEFEQEFELERQAEEFNAL